MTASVYVDANILIYYVEGTPQLMEAAESVFDTYLAGGVILVTSEITVGECLRGVSPSDAKLADAYRDLLAGDALLHLVPVTRRIIERAAAIGAEFRLKLVDAIHVATAEMLGCTVFLTNDRGIRAPAGIALETL